MVKFLLKTVLVLAVLGAAGAGYVVFGRTQDGVVAVVRPVRGPAVQAVYATGTVEASVMFPVAPRQSAHLAELLADEGQTVMKGQILARLEDDDLQMTLDELRARADLAQKDYERKQGLADSGAVSHEALEKARADLDMTVAAAERAQVNLDYMKLIAPETGTVIRRDGEIGELIAANQPVFWLACCGNLRIEAEVDEEDIALVRQGQKALISADAFPGEIFQGAVQSITPKGDPVSRSYRVRIELPADTRLMIGMTAETNIIIREDQAALLVPASAVAGGKAAIVDGDIKNGKAAEKSVKLGAQTAGVAEILSGIADDDLVVLDAEKMKDARRAVKFKMQDWKVP